MTHLIEVKSLKTQFKTEAGIVNAVNGISYYIDEQEIVGIVGESGCGKSVSQLSVLQLIPSPPGEILDGEVWFDGENLLKLNANGKKMRNIRGGKISIIFQEPMTSLNPTMTIKDQLAEMLKLHLKTDRNSSRGLALELLKRVGIPDSEHRLNNYPHQFSGGMRQRVMIAMAVSCNPRLLIADEPTTALDVTTQAQILELMKDMAEQFQTSLVIVTHNLGVVARYAKRIYVMYAGSIVESGPAKEIFRNPRHPYTIGLLKSVPRLDEPKGRKLVPIEGLPPNLIDMPDRCAFKPRCAYKEQCQIDEYPELRRLTDQHYVRCHVDITNSG